MCWNSLGLSGFCAIASFELFTYLHEQKQKPFFALASDTENLKSIHNYSEHHCWIVCQDLVVDITYGQFNLTDDPIYIEKNPCSQIHQNWKTIDYYTYCKKNLKVLQSVFDLWIDQKPYPWNHILQESVQEARQDKKSLNHWK